MGRLLIMSLPIFFGGCDTNWVAMDQDGDGYRIVDGDCWEADEGPEGSNLHPEDIFPGAFEMCDGVDNDCDGEVDESLWAIGVSVDAALGECADGEDNLHSSQFTWYGEADCDTRWYIACNDPDAVVEVLQGIFTDDDCAEAQETNPTWPREADVDGDGVAEPVAECGWLDRE